MDPELAAVFLRRRQQQDEQQENESSALEIDTTTPGQTSPPLESSHRDAPSVHEEKYKEEEEEVIQDIISSTKLKDQRNEDIPRSQDRPVKKDDVENGYGEIQQEIPTAWEKYKKIVCYGVIFSLLVILIVLISSLVQFRAKHANSPTETGRYIGDGYVPPNDEYESPNSPSTPLPTDNNPSPSPLNPTAGPALKTYLEDEMGIAIESDDAKLAFTQLLEEAKENDGSKGEVPLTPKTVQRFALINMDLAIVRGGNRNSLQSAELIWGKFNQDECKWAGVTCNNNEEVTDIWLGKRSLAGTIPTEVGLLQSLSYLDLSKNNLQGSLPEELYDIVSLTKLFLYKNELTGTISTKIGDLFGLTDFILHNNRITGPIPSTLRSNDNRGIFGIRHFNVYQNQMTGNLPSNQMLRQMYYMDLGRNQFSGTLPAELGVDFVRLRHLFLDHNQFSGTVPSSIINAGDGRLHSLRLNDNQFQGELPGHDLTTELNEFAVQNNQFTSMDRGTCKLWVLENEGELVEFNSDCDICDCGDKSNMCQWCFN